MNQLKSVSTYFRNRLVPSDICIYFSDDFKITDENTVRNEVCI